jgi:signal peptidase I
MRHYTLFSIFAVTSAIITIAVLISFNETGSETNIPKENGGIFISLTGLSMYPIIKDGESKPCEVKEGYSTGDIVTFTKRSQNISHRVIGDVSGNYLTKGDNNLLPDPFLVGKEEILCKVIV